MAGRHQAGSKHRARRRSGTPQTWNAYPTGDMRGPSNGPRHARSKQAQSSRWTYVLAAVILAFAVVYGLFTTIGAFTL